MQCRIGAGEDWGITEEFHGKNSNLFYWIGIPLQWKESILQPYVSTGLKIKKKIYTAIEYINFCGLTYYWGRNKANAGRVNKAIKSADHICKPQWFGSVFAPTLSCLLSRAMSCVPTIRRAASPLWHTVLWDWLGYGILMRYQVIISILFKN